MQNIQQELLNFLDSDGIEVDTIIQLFDKEQIANNMHELNQIFRLIAKISNRHYRTSNFNEKLEQILLFFKKGIQNNFSNSEIYKIFAKNKQILLFLIHQEILVIDKSIFTQIINTFYFFPEIKNLLNETSIQKLNDENLMMIPLLNVIENFFLTKDVLASTHTVYKISSYHSQ